MNAPLPQSTNRSAQFASEVYNVWGSYTIWSISSAPNVHGLLGPTMSIGGNFPGLGTGHYVTGMWVSE